MAFSLSAMFGLIGILMIAIAGMMPLTEPNRVMGYRLKATMNDPTIWKLTHRFAAKSIVISSVAMIGAGELKEAIEHYERALPLLSGDTDPVEEAQTLSALGAARAALGQVDEAQAAEERARALLQRAGALREEVW